jgi:formylglycine-generating enzyme required for sulfatase activity
MRHGVLGRSDGCHILYDLMIISLAGLCLSLVLVGACTRAPTAVPTSGPGLARTRTMDGAEMMLVPAGEFLMGSPDADPKAAADERPQHTIYLDAFWIDRTEVTNARDEEEYANQLAHRS